MKERPILFSAPMVRAILEGRKTMTRRVIKAPSIKYFDGRPNEWRAGLCFKGHAHFNNGPSKQPSPCDFTIQCPFGEEGDRLWVRESARVVGWASNGKSEIDIQYQADMARVSVPYPARLKPVRFGNLLSNGTYREASRVLLEIVSVRVERLNDISERDATKEGVMFMREIPDADETLTDRNLFEILWESINGSGSWDANPWVWVIEFTRV